MKQHCPDETTAKCLLRCVVAAALTLALLGALEFAVARFGDPSRDPLSELLAYMLFYMLVGCVIGLCIGIVVSVLPRNTRPMGVSRGLFSATLSSIVALFVALGSWLNIEVLPGMLSSVSIAGDALLLAFCATVFTMIIRSHRARAASTHSGSSWRSPLVPALVLCGVLLVIGAVAPTKEAAAVGNDRTCPSTDLNVLLLVVDALRADHLSCYGYERQTSPNLDALAADGILVQNAYSQAPLTKSSTASLVTSLYPSTHNVRGLLSVIPDAASTLMAEMQDAGYRTSVLSANAFVAPEFGFDRGVDYMFGGSLNVTKKSSIGGVLRQFASTTGRARWLVGLLNSIGNGLPRAAVELSPYEEHAGLLNDRLLSWIDAAPDRPFFAYVHYMEPHMPLAPPTPYDTMFDERPAAPHDVEFPWQAPGLLPFIEADPLSPEEHERLVAQYDATIAYFDAELGRLIGELAARGLEDRTLVLITADHGEAFYAHGAWGHGNSLYEELIRVPLVVWAPGDIPGGRSWMGPIRHIDVMPTLLSAVEASPKPGHSVFEGESLWPELKGDRAFEKNLPVFAEQVSQDQSARCLRVGNWKLIHVESPEEEHIMLFDLARDPCERHDLAASHRTERDEMLARLIQLHERSRDKRIETSEHTMDESLRETLGALGYIQ